MLKFSIANYTIENYYDPKLHDPKLRLEGHPPGVPIGMINEP